MNLFYAYIVHTGEELCIAARTANHAVEVLMTFWVARTGSAPGEFNIGHGASGPYEDNEVVHNVALGDTAGVIVRQEDGSMIFEPAISA